MPLPIESEQDLALGKKMKSLFNKLTEANLQQIVKQIEQLYTTNPRHKLNELLYESITKTIIQNEITNERRVTEFILVLACLHVKIGYEITAFFLEKLINEMVTILDDHKGETESKKLDNFMLVTINLYSCSLTSCKLLFDILKRLVNIFSDKAIDCIFLIVKHIGQRLKKEEPKDFENIMADIQANFSNKKFQFNNK